MMAQFWGLLKFDFGNCQWPSIGGLLGLRRVESSRQHMYQKFSVGASVVLKLLYSYIVTTAQKLKASKREQSVCGL
jgi:hypothetical protein